MKMRAILTAVYEADDAQLQEMYGTTDPYEAARIDAGTDDPFSLLELTQDQHLEVFPQVYAIGDGPDAAQEHEKQRVLHARRRIEKLLDESERGAIEARLMLETTQALGHSYSHVSMAFMEMTEEGLISLDPEMVIWRV